MRSIRVDTLVSTHITRRSQGRVPFFAHAICTLKVSSFSSVAITLSASLSRRFSELDTAALRSD